MSVYLLVKSSGLRRKFSLPSGGDFFLYLQATLIVACSIYIRVDALKGVRHEQIGKT